MAEKEREKIDHYQDLIVEIYKKCGTANALLSVVLIAIGALGTAVTKNTWDLEFTPESLLVRNSKELKKDPRHLIRL